MAEPVKTSAKTVVALDAETILARINFSKVSPMKSLELIRAAIVSLANKQ